MSSLSYIIPKRNRPVWIEGTEAVDIDTVALVEIPLMGTIAAGEPIELCLQQESVAVPVNMVRKNTYALKVSGHSMIDDAIQDGDIVIIEKRESAENGETVVAKINGDSVTLKRLYIEPEGIRLQPANPEIEPIILKNGEIEILGIVTGVIRIP